MLMYCDLLGKNWFPNYKHVLELATIQYVKRYIGINFFLHKQSEKARVCFLTRCVIACNFTVGLGIDKDFEIA